MDDASLAGDCFLVCCYYTTVFVFMGINSNGVRIIGWLEMAPCDNNRGIRTIGGRELEKLKIVVLLVKHVSFFTFILKLCSQSFQIFKN